MTKAQKLEKIAERLVKWAQPGFSEPLFDIIDDARELLGYELDAEGKLIAAEAAA